LERYKTIRMKLLLGDCLDKLKELDDNSVDSIVTDPPYGLSFMGKKWDYDVPSTEIWEECIRVLKPGGHLLSFAGSRTYHRMAVRIEDAGFEIRDQIMWVYGSGFPKSHNIGHKVEDMQGWGTALKPAHEPIVMARKPFSGTVADNVLEWGTGGINIDGCRIDGGERDARENNTSWGIDRIGVETDIKGNKAIGKTTLGRFPANIIFDEEAGKILDEQSGISKSSGGSGDKSMGALGKNGKYGNYALDVKPANLGGLGDTGGASRFFYCPKTSKSDRSEGNTHPTVKPTDLMGYLIRLVTPKGGVVLDPFMGSGSTGKGAVREGMVFIGIERESEYFEIAEARIQNEIDNVGKPKKVSKQKETRVEPIVENKFWE